MALRLANDRVTLTIDPDRGGGVLGFAVDGRDVFRPAGQGGPLALASFPLVPFANRIAGDGNRLSLPPNAPDVDPANAIHGYGWLARWKTVSCDDQAIVIAHDHDAADWPWAYRAEQRFTLRDDGFVHGIAVENLSDRAMPAGLGLHPYFPRTGARLSLGANGVWRADHAGPPTAWEAMTTEPEWFEGNPHDHCFTRHSGAILIEWPSHRLHIVPDPALGFAHVYIPAGEDYCCIEPVSHIPDAVNRSEPGTATGLRWLEPRETWVCETRFGVEATR